MKNKTLKFFFLSNLSNFFTYVIQLTLSRSLLQEDFGTYNSINALNAFFMIFATVISFFFAKHIAPFKENLSKDFLGKATKFMFKFTFISFLITLPLLFFLKKYLHLDNYLPLFILLLNNSIIMVVFYLRGISQGMGNYIELSIIMITQTLSQLILIVIFIGLLGHSYTAAVFIFGLSFLISGVLNWLIINKHSIADKQSSTEFHIDRSSIKKDLLPIALAYLILGLALNIDITLVKHFFSAHDTAIYSVAALIARIAFYLPSVLAFVLFPEIVKQTKKELQVKILIQISIISFLISLSFITVILINPTFIINLLFGSDFVEANNYLLWISITMGILAILNNIYNYYAAKGKVLVLSLNLIMYLLLIGSIFIVNVDSIYTMVKIFLFGTIVTLLINYIYIFIKGKKHQRS